LADWTTLGEIAIEICYSLAVIAVTWGAIGGVYALAKAIAKFIFGEKAEK